MALSNKGFNNTDLKPYFESLMSYLSTLWLSAIGMWDESERAAAASQNNPSKPPQWRLQVGFKTVIIQFLRHKPHYHDNNNTLDRVTQVSIAQRLSI